MKQPHGGLLVARRLKAHGVTKLFTLSGGHLFSIYDGCRTEGVDLIDTRHESAAAFAAEGWAKVTREPGVCALTAGPGVTNGMSAIASAHKNNSPMVVLGGRAPQLRWGQGSLQEIDHVPFVAPLTKSAKTATATADIPVLVDEAIAAALGRPPGRPSSTSRSTSSSWRPTTAERAAEPDPAALPPADGGEIERVAALLGRAERPVMMAGTDLYWGHGESALRALSEALGVPVFLNGLARGCLPADHPNFFSRRARDGAQGGRRRARDRRADGLPARLRRELRRGHRDRVRSSRPSPTASRRARSRPSSTAACRRRSPRCARRARRRRRAERTSGWRRRCATNETEKRAAEGAS